MSITGFSTNRDYSVERLNRLAKRAKQRLDMSSWFYSSDVTVTPTKRGKDYRNVVIEVKEGFLYRFYGSYAYGVFGKENIWGNGERVMLEMGYNRQLVQVGLPRLGKYFLNFEGGNKNSYYYQLGKDGYLKTNTQKIGAFMEFGYRLGWDTGISLISSVTHLTRNDYSLLTNESMGGVRLEWNGKTGIFSSHSGYFFRTQYEALFPFQAYRISLDFRKYIPFGQTLYLASRLRFFFETPGLPDYERISLNGADGIRDEGAQNTMGAVAAALNVELRWDFFRSVFFTIFDTSFQGLLFFDTGRAYDSWNMVQWKDMDYAAGFGVRLLFNNPVFVPLRIEMGWGKDGNISGYICSEVPF